MTEARYLRIAGPERALYDFPVTPASLLTIDHSGYVYLDAVRLGVAGQSFMVDIETGAVTLNTHPLLIAGWHIDPKPYLAQDPPPIKHGHTRRTE